MSFAMFKYLNVFGGVFSGRLDGGGGGKDILLFVISNLRLRS